MREREKLSTVAVSAYPAHFYERTIFFLHLSFSHLAVAAEQCLHVVVFFAVVARRQVFAHLSSSIFLRDARNVSVAIL